MHQCMSQADGIVEDESGSAASGQGADSQARDRADRGAALALKVATDMQRANFPARMFTSNLHLVACRWCAV